MVSEQLKYDKIRIHNFDHLNSTIQNSSRMKTIVECKVCNYAGLCPADMPSVSVESAREFSDYSRISAADFHYYGSVGISTCRGDRTIHNHGTTLTLATSRPTNCTIDSSEATKRSIHGSRCYCNPISWLWKAGLRQWLPTTGTIRNESLLIKSQLIRIFSRTRTKIKYWILEKSKSHEDRQKKVFLMSKKII